MAQKGAQLDKEIICCSICLDLLRDPVTIPCGHNYCMSCLRAHWDSEDERKIHSCPQCRKTFVPRPVLVKNTMLAVLVEELKNTGLKAAAADHCYAGPGSVACDVCTGRKLKAVKSCLQCLVSYCEKHLQPHFESAAFGQHKLVDPSEKLRENICSHHAEVMKMFCRTDLQCICYLCSVDEHQGHNVVSAATERAQRQRELEVSRQTIQHKIWNKVKDVAVLQQEADTITRSADEAAEKSEKIFTDLIRLMEKRRRDVKQMIRSQQEIEAGRIKELQEELKQEISELRRKNTELEKLCHTEDHNQFLRNYPSLSEFSEPVDSSSVFSVRPVHYFKDVTAAVSELRDKLQHILGDEWTNISPIAGLPSNTGDEPKTRAHLLKYSHKLTLDPNTVNVELSLSKGNRRATHMKQKQKYPEHADRFTICGLVLSKESLTGRCYWEVECSVYGVYVAVAYKNIRRKGTSDACIFGYNDKSWALDCHKTSCTFWYNNVRLPISGPCSSRIGVYLDHTAGILSFYSISETMTLLHTVRTMFTQPLYAGLWLTGGSAEFCELK